MNGFLRVIGQVCFGIGAMMAFTTVPTLVLEGSSPWTLLPLVVGLVLALFGADLWWTYRVRRTKEAKP
jgi:hypothetical protein